MKGKKHISIVVAVAEKMAIGNNNQLLCHLPDDLKMFKNLTAGHTVVMGKNTWHSLPFKPLPNRQNIVITDIKDEIFEGAISAFSIEDAISKMPDNEESFVMGGAMVYRQFMPLAGRLYITRVHHDFEADTYFPDIEEEVWSLVSAKDHASDEKHLYPFTYEVYERRS
jgi:dihydrofolate reductase